MTWASGGERGRFPGDAVVEPGTERDQQVALLQRRDGGDGAVHAGHPVVQAVAVGKGSAGHQRRHDGNPGQLRKCGQLGRRLGLDHAPTDVEDRRRRGSDEVGRRTDLLAVRFSLNSPID
nr:hypothetical protein GCM10017611_55920 [Rhodococcus wratislaviensis]